jgi:hypothetical protein
MDLPTHQPNDEKQIEPDYGLPGRARLLRAHGGFCRQQEIGDTYTIAERVAIAKGYGRSEDQGDSVAGGKYYHRPQ